MLALRTQRVPVQDRRHQGEILRIARRPLIGNERPDTMNGRMPVDTALERRMLRILLPAGLGYLARQRGDNRVLAILEGRKLRRCLRGVTSSADRGRGTPDHTPSHQANRPAGAEWMFFYPSGAQ